MANSQLIRPLSTFGAGISAGISWHWALGAPLRIVPLTYVLPAEHAHTAAIRQVSTAQKYLSARAIEPISNDPVMVVRLEPFAVGAGLLQSEVAA